MKHWQQFKWRVQGGGTVTSLFEASTINEALKQLADAHTDIGAHWMWIFEAKSEKGLLPQVHGRLDELLQTKVSDSKIKDSVNYKALAIDINNKFKSELKEWDAKVNAYSDSLDLSEFSADRELTDKVIRYVKSKGYKDVDYTSDDAVLAFHDSVATKDADSEVDNIRKLSASEFRKWVNEHIVSFVPGNRHFDIFKLDNGKYMANPKVSNEQFNSVDEAYAFYKQKGFVDSASVKDAVDAVKVVKAMKDSKTKIKDRIDFAIVDYSTKLFYAGNDNWVPLAGNAKTFKTMQEAVKAKSMLKHSMNLDIVQVNVNEA